LDADFRSNIEVVGLEPDAHLLRLADGSTESYERLVIATGARLYAPLDGTRLPGVYNFKSLSSAEELITRVRDGRVKTAIVVGAGLIGTEVALMLNQLGVSITQVDRSGQVMSTMLDEDTARIAVDAMRASGVDVHLEAKAQAFVGTDRATGVLMESGDVLQADCFVAATGIRPVTEPFESSGIARNWGLLVDEYLKTSLDDVYAAGDVVESVDRLTGERYVHAFFPNAVEQGRVAGLNAVGQSVRYEGAEQMIRLDQLKPPIVVAGSKVGDEVLRARGDDSLRTLYLQGDVLVGFQLVGDTRGARALRTLLNRRQNVRSIKSQLLDPNFGQGVVVSAER
jgi:nitrite reductase (NADH) large subunit